jgi:hypothetical protein
MLLNDAEEKTGHKMTQQKIIAGALVMMAWTAIAVATLGGGFVLIH